MAAAELSRAAQAIAPEDSSAYIQATASANLDLGLALVAADKPDEAADAALAAVTSGRLVPSNYWRVSEVVARIEDRDRADAAMVRAAFLDTYPA